MLLVWKFVFFGVGVSRVWHGPVPSVLTWLDLFPFSSPLEGDLIPIGWEARGNIVWHDISEPFGMPFGQLAGAKSDKDNEYKKMQ